ncbi:hypothetical protein F5877DRAFT_84702 [Lentinula edodes]|nr:hypothetical protein F5877DRAFT_84702 [Lentinula edodes]
MSLGFNLALSGETPTSPRAFVGAASLDDHSADLARGLIDLVETVQPKQYKLNTLLRKFFYKLGFNTATYPMLTCAVVFTFIGLINIGWTKFDIETDPVRLWQIFITSTDQENHPVLSFEHLQHVPELEKHIRHKLVSLPNNLTLDDVCFSPAGPGSPCVVQSVMGWFGGSLDGYDENTYKDRIERCVRSPVECLPDFGQPLAPHYVLGGTRDANLNTYLDAPALVMTAVLSSSLSPPDPEHQQTFERAAMEWERTLRVFLEEVKIRAPTEAGLYVDFSTGVSLEEEIGKEGNTDVRVGGSGPSSTRRASPNNTNRWRLHWRAAISWLRSYTLTSYTLLALISLVLVLPSISTSVALFSLVGVKVTLVIAEVIPFLVLAVGVDVFLLMGELERVDSHGLYAGNSKVPNGPGDQGHRGRGNERNAAADEDDGIAENGDAEARMMSPTRTTHSSRHFPNPSRHNHHTSSLSSYSSAPSSAYPNPSYLPPPARIALTLSLIGPSILLSTPAESVAFLLGALVPMPAVRNFALYAAGRVMINALLQSAWPDISSWGRRRQRYPERTTSPDRTNFNNSDHGPSYGAFGAYGESLTRGGSVSGSGPSVKAVVLIVFGGIFVAGIIGMQGIELGLDQRLALPTSSYLVSYFDKMDQYFDVGPPVYFVVRDVDVTRRDGQQKSCGKFTTCEKMSLSNILEAERTRDQSQTKVLSTLSSKLQSDPLFVGPSELSLLSASQSSSYLADPAASWIDTFFAWLDPEMDTCCRVRKRDPSVLCRPRDGARLCRPCFEDRDPGWNVTMEGFPEGKEFVQYAKWWLASEAGKDLAAV